MSSRWFSFSRFSTISSLIFCHGGWSRQKCVLNKEKEVGYPAGVLYQWTTDCTLLRTDRFYHRVLIRTRAPLVVASCLDMIEIRHKDCSVEEETS